MSETMPPDSDPVANLSLEARLLGNLLTAPDLGLWPAVRTRILDPRYFYRNAHQLIWQAGCAVYDAGGVPEPATIGDQLQRSGLDPDNAARDVLYALQVTGWTADLWMRESSEAAEKWNVDAAERIKQHALKRFLYGPATTLAGYAFDQSDAATAAAALAKLDAELEPVRRGLAAGSRLKPQTLAEMRKRPKPTPLIDRFYMAGGVSTVFSAPSAGKTCYLVDQACHVALGREWMGRAVQGGPVVYLAAEGGSGIMGRFDAWIQTHNGGEDIPSLYVIPEAAQLLEDADRTELLAQLRSLPEPPVWVIIDTVSQTSAGADENSNSDMRDYVTALTAIRSATGAHVTCVHHSLKNGEGYRGASALIGNVDTAIEITRSDDDSTVKCYKQQRDGWAKFLPFHFTADQTEVEGYDGLTFGVFRVVDKPARSSKAADGTPDEVSDLSPKERQVWEALAVHSFPSRRALVDWMAPYKVSRQTVHNTVNKLSELGWISEDSTGLIQSTPACPKPSNIRPIGQFGRSAV